MQEWAKRDLVSAEAVRNILWDNPRACYGL
jgi:hypothetical protein